MNELWEKPKIQTEIELIIYEVLVELPEVLVVDWSPKMRLRKSVTMRGSPLRSGIFGSHPSNSLALEMSGLRLWGSSWVFSWNMIFALGSIVSWTTLASSSMVNSPGFPKLKGPIWSPSIRRISPSTRSDTYWKLLVCLPSPYTVNGSFLSACIVFINLETNNKFAFFLKWTSTSSLSIDMRF